MTKAAVLGLVVTKKKQLFRELISLATEFIVGSSQGFICIEPSRVYFSPKRFWFPPPPPPPQKKLIEKWYAAQMAFGNSFSFSCPPAFTPLGHQGSPLYLPPPPPPHFGPDKTLVATIAPHIQSFMTHFTILLTGLSMCWRSWTQLHMQTENHQPSPPSCSCSWINNYKQKQTLQPTLIILYEDTPDSHQRRLRKKEPFKYGEYWRDSHPDATKRNWKSKDNALKVKEHVATIGNSPKKSIGAALSKRAQACMKQSKCAYRARMRQSRCNLDSAYWSVELVMSCLKL